MAQQTVALKSDASTTVATALIDEVGGIAIACSKIIIGADDTNDGFVSSANPLPISVASIPSHAVTNAGTFAVQAAQSGTWNVTNVSGTISLPTGAATAAKQPALGTAGTASSDVITVQGVTSMTPLVIADGGGSITVDGTVTVTGAGSTTQYTEDGASAGGESLTLAGAVRRDTAASSSATDGDYSTLNTDATGRLWTHVGTIDGGTISTITNVVHVDDNSGSLTVDGTVAISGTVTVTGTGGTFPVTDSSGSLTVDAPVGTPVFVRLSDGSSAITTLAVSLASVPSHAVTNAGTFAVQVDGSALTSLQLLDDAVFVDDAAFTPGTSKLFAIGFQADETASDSVDEGDIGCPRMTLDRKQHVCTEFESNSMRAAGTSCTPKFAAIAASSSGNNTLVAAVNPKKIRVLAYNLIGNGAVNAKFQSGAGGTDLTGLKYIAAAGGGICAPYNPVGWFETASNTLLNLNLSGAVAVGGELVYIEV